MIYPSTFSIVAYDPDENAWGIAVASKFPAVGAVVPWARAGAGAVATQSYANTSYGPRGLDMMENGASAQQTLQTLLADDSEREHRQVGLVDASGQSATFTGSNCHEWAGGAAENGYAIQGNILVGAQVVHVMQEAFLTTTGGLAWRLHAALLAGDRAGGDRRGRQSSAIYIVRHQGGYGGFNDRWVDYRVDDHPDPVQRLGELLELNDLYFGKSPVSNQVKLSGASLQKLQQVMSAQGYYNGKLNGVYSAETRQALQEFIGNENFEERIDFDNGVIDQPVFDYLLKKFGED